jgi:cysteine desulfurase family protein (TIGR01976 family)
VPERVIDAVSTYFRESNANHEGVFLTSVRSDELIAGARAAVADLLGAASPGEVKFGANMTTLTQHVSRSIAATLQPGDEVLVTVLDHEANVSPWQHVAADRGLTVRTVDIHPEDCTLDLNDFEAKLGPRTRLVAVGYASNATGTINPVRRIVERAHAAGALAYVDAVHYAPHGPIDVRDIDADFLVCSAYKWFGPHVGVLYGKAAVLDRLPTYKVRPAYDRFETGTLNHEGIAGTLAAVDYLASVGARFGAGHRGRFTGVTGRVLDLRCAMAVIAEHEQLLAGQFTDGLAALPGVQLFGIGERDRMADRTPTFALTFDGLPPRRVAQALASRGIFVWDGDFYAQALIERLGLYASGGVVRIGFVHYNTAAEVDRLLEALDGITGRAAGTAVAPG